MSLYLILNLASFSVPFLYSFEPHMRFIRYWKQVFLAIALVAVFFIIWDVIFTQNGVWGFNESYLLGIDILNLPIEEWLFFICIPYACVFTHYAFQYFFPTIKIPYRLTKVFTLIVISITLLLAFTHIEKAYTFYNYVILSIILMISLWIKEEQLQVFYITFLIILVPFFIVNGILTGSFIEDQVVWYNNNENLGIRIGTIPVEDIGYAFSMLYLNIMLIEYFKKKRWIKK